MGAFTRAASYSILSETPHPPNTEPKGQRRKALGAGHTVGVSAAPSPGLLHPQAEAFRASFLHNLARCMRVWNGSFQSDVGGFLVAALPCALSEGSAEAWGKGFRNTQIQVILHRWFMS